MPRRALWTCSKCAPWLGVVKCAPEELRRVAVAAQWALLQRCRSAVGAPRGRCANADVGGGVCTETSRSPTASSRRVFGACTACALSVIVSIAFSRRLYGVAMATIALPRRSYCVHRRLQGDDTAIPLRCEQSQHNCIKAAWSLPHSLCVQLHHGCWTPASRAISGLCRSIRSRTMQTLETWAAPPRLALARTMAMDCVNQ